MVLLWLGAGVLFLGFLKSTNAAEKAVGSQAQTSPQQPGVAGQPPAAGNPEVELKELKTKYAELEEKHKHLTQDRDNLLEQTRRILKERNELVDLTDSAKKAVEEKTVLESRIKELEGLLNEAGARAGGASSELSKAQARVRELELKLEQAVAEQSESNRIKKLKDEIAQGERRHKELQSEKKSLEQRIQDLESRDMRELVEARKEIKQVRRDEGDLRKALEGVQGELDKSKKLYADTVKEKEGLAKELAKLPSRFSSVAHQNERLIRETADMHYNLGVYYSQQQRMDLAAREFEKVLDLRPDDASSHYNLGQIYAEHVTDRAKAIKHFEKFLHLAPDDKDAEWVRRYLLTWQSYYGKEIIK
ncbi:MAG: tetratricopeptide repeat protein [Candidatus Omnitrophica bacterium]|nr:tetratricopeptide repeat protein [Candidatus Omnitrophota bacterium]